MTKTWFITGSSRGMGRELVEKLLARGDRVAATARRPEQLDDLADTYGDLLWRHALDVTDSAQIRKVVDEAFAELGHIDVIVSNAGFGILGAAEELDDDDTRRMLETNLLGSITLAQAVTPHLRQQGGGRFIQLSSMGGHIAFPGFSLYHAAKWGVEGFFEAWGPEVEPFGITTTLVEPGLIRTSFYEVMGRKEPLPAYANNTAIMRQEAPLEEMAGDQSKVVDGLIAAGENPEPPRRLVMGSDAYSMITDALQARILEIRAQHDTAGLTDVDGFAASN
ncbi:SDR family oxidoreductase [Frondihabitans sp. VKM Ac-2883]|uniref:SDR family oxidoreductase n=1 Tax=Frondihabitans sp. VKM Ac-2883 TaxID=2783823 RepID=UPI00188C2903|nr:SDR family oxidoreductase [Frondihabitans sp. VKM Ac-2883]MBF4577517.1 SDR family oxidoreductase [Frondihabitans sp. VKM Ac-2883]